MDALEIIDARYFAGRPEMEVLLAEAEERLQLAERLRELREGQHLSQVQVAKRVGTTRSVIARLERTGYRKHTLTTLKKVAGAMGYAVKVEFVRLGDASGEPGAPPVRKAAGRPEGTKPKATVAKAAKPKG